MLQRFSVYRFFSRTIIDFCFVVCRFLHLISVFLNVSSLRMRVFLTDKFLLCHIERNFIVVFFFLCFSLQAEQAQTDACEKFEAMSARGKQELTSFRTRRVAAFKKSLIELAELEVKHAKSQYEYLRQSVLALRELA